MRRLFKKGQRVRNKLDGRVMEVLNYIRNKGKYVVECAWFDVEKKEVRTSQHEEDKLLKAS